MMLTINIILSVTSLLLLLSPPPVQGRRKPPHILVIMVDDMGWRDVGFRDPELYTPNIDDLASKGVLLNYSYMLKSCTPSRASFLTGTYAFRMGMQDRSLHDLRNNSLPLDKRVFPQELQDNGYSTHYVGKWHLGFCRREMTPTYRGFDTFYGMYNGVGDHYTRISQKNGYDLQNNTGEDLKADLSAKGKYSTRLFARKAVEIIKNHNDSKPLFLFLSYQAVHAPLQAPKRYNTKCANVTAGADRKKLCAMMAAVDEGVGEVMAALNETGFSDNLVTLFTTDNGGPVKIGSSNWPLRGSKVTNWEGGTRAVSFLHSKKHLPLSPYTWNGLIHAVDWYPTLLHVAGLRVDTCGMDGIDNWYKIAHNKTSKRTEFVYNLNEVMDNYALRWNQFKLVSFKRPHPDGWFNPPAGVMNESAPVKLPKYMLFDIEQDPTEHDNLATNENYTAILKLMKTILRGYKAGIEPVRVGNRTTAGLPSNHGGLWTTDWC